jgi:hypothetical protein
MQLARNPETAQIGATVAVTLTAFEVLWTYLVPGITYTSLHGGAHLALHKTAPWLAKKLTMSFLQKTLCLPKDLAICLRNKIMNPKGTLELQKIIGHVKHYFKTGSGSGL